MVERFAVVGDGVEQTGFAHALALVINHHAAGGLRTLEADVDGAVGQVARRFKAERFEREGVVGADVAFFLDEEQFVVGLIGRQEADPFAIQGEAVERTHAEDGMNLGVVVFLDPLRELAVERLQRTQVQIAGQELVAHRAEKPFDFSLGRAVAHRRVVQQAADAGADLEDFLGGVNGAVVHIERVRHAAFVKGGAERFDERVHVFGREELAVATDARGIVQEGDEPGLHRRAVDVDIRPVERVGLPHFIGVGLGEGQPVFVGAVLVGLEQFVLLDQPAEGVGRDLRTGEQALLRCTAGRARPASAFCRGLWAAPCAMASSTSSSTTLRTFALVGARFGFP